MKSDKFKVLIPRGYTELTLSQSYSDFSEIQPKTDSMASTKMEWQLFTARFLRPFSIVHIILVFYATRRAESNSAMVCTVAAYLLLIFPA